MDNCQVFELYAYWSSVPTGVVDDSEATLNPEQQTWTSTVCRHLLTFIPPILCMYFALFSCSSRNGKLLFPSPYHYSYITTHHIIIHTLPQIIPCHISHLIISCHTIYFITPTPTHSIPNHLSRQQLIPYGRKFWRGIYFGGLAVLRAIRQYFIRQKLHSVMSSLLRNHSKCTRSAARRTSLIVGMEFTFESCIRGYRFSKEFCTPKERVGFSVNARKVVLMTCTRSL